MHLKFKITSHCKISLSFSVICQYVPYKVNKFILDLHMADCVNDNHLNIYWMLFNHGH